MSVFMRRQRGFRQFCFLATVLVLAIFIAGTRTAPAQTQKASISGTVADPTNAVVIDAQVTARNTATNTVRVVKTNEEGIYRIPALDAGTYELSVEKQGFKRLLIKNVEVTVAQLLTLDAHLSVETVVGEVEVVAGAAAPVDLETAQVSNVIDSEQISGLPLLLRNPYQLVLLSAGVATSAGDPTGLGGFAVNGSRERNNNFLLDGVDNNNDYTPGGMGGVSSIDPDATAEFRVITNNFQAQYGRDTGAIVDVITKGGSNTVHGNAYWFGRYSALTARDYFNPSVDANGNPEAKNPFIRNIFGASFGGPIKKDKLFYFVNYEGNRFITPTITYADVPSAAFRTGVFTAYGVPIDATQSSTQNVTANTYGRTLGLDPTVQKILNYYPTPNAGDVVPGALGLYKFDESVRNSGDNITGRVDDRLTAKHSLSVSYHFNRGVTPSSGEFLPGLGGSDSYDRTQSVSLGFVSVFRPTLINEFRFGASRVNSQYNCVNDKNIDGIGPIDSEGNGTDYGYYGSWSGITSFACWATYDADKTFVYQGTYHTVDDMTWVKGRHIFKFGGEFRDAYSNSTTSFFAREEIQSGIYSPGVFATAAGSPDPSTQAPYFPGNQAEESAVQNLLWVLHGGVYNVSQTQFFNRGGQRGPNDIRGYRQRELAVFFQDTYKLRPNLTLDYGLRYEYFGVPFEVNGNSSVLLQDPSGSGPFTFQLTGSGVHLYRNDPKNFGPRIGLIWDPYGKGKTSIRLGYGIFYDRLFGNLFGYTRGNPPLEESPSEYPTFYGGQYAGMTINDIATANASITTQATSAAVPNGSFFRPSLLDQGIRTPNSQNWNFGIQQALSGNLQLEINYVGSKGTHLLRAWNANPPQPNLVNQLVTYCSNPTNAYGCSLYTLQGGFLYYGAEYGYLPFDAVNNNAFYYPYEARTIANSIYNALQVTVTKRLSHGLQFQGAYTWSHNIDNGGDPIVSTYETSPFPVNQFNMAAERGNSQLDTRHRFTASYLEDFNIGRGKRFLNQGIAGRIFEGWRLGGITTFSTGLPYEIFGSIDTMHTGNVSRADLVGNPNAPWTPSGTPSGPLIGPNPNAFANAPFGRDGTVHRDSFFGPHYQDWDMSLTKNTKITERVALEFRSEFYNFFNHPNFTKPNVAFGEATFGQSLSEVGQADGTTGARQLQFAMKLKF